MKRGGRLAAVGRRGKRNAVLDAQWRNDVLKVYGLICQWPKCLKFYDEIHHYEGKQARPELRHTVTNGRPLCRNHHRKAHDNPALARRMLKPARMAAIALYQAAGVRNP